MPRMLSGAGFRHIVTATAFVVSAALVPASEFGLVPPEPTVFDVNDVNLAAGEGVVLEESGRGNSWDALAAGEDLSLEGGVPPLPESVLIGEPARQAPASSWTLWPSAGPACKSCGKNQCSHRGSWLRCGDADHAGCWTARVDGLGLWRNSPRSQPLFTTLTGTPPNQQIGPVILNANQLVSDAAGGTRVSLFRTNACGASVEATYIFAGNFFAERSLPFAADSYAVASGIYGNIWGQDPPALFPPPLSSVQTQLLGQLQSFEVNSRTPLRGGKTLFISGFRWLQWQERLRMSDEFINQPPGVVPPIGYDFYDTRCVNDLYGGQIGFDSQLLAYRSGLRVEGLVKAGAYYNSAVQQSSYRIVSTTNFFDTVTVGGQPAAGAFVGEVGLTGVVPLGRHFDLRLGYFGLWLESIAQPVNQLTGQDLTQPDTPPPTGSLNTSGSLVLQGISLGLEGHW